MHAIKCILKQCFCFSFIVAAQCSSIKKRNVPIPHPADQKENSTLSSIAIASTGAHAIVCIGSNNTIHIATAAQKPLTNKSIKAIGNSTTANQNSITPDGTTITITSTAPDGIVLVGSHNTIYRDILTQQQQQPAKRASSIAGRNKNNKTSEQNKCKNPDASKETSMEARANILPSQPMSTVKSPPIQRIDKKSEHPIGNTINPTNVAKNPNQVDNTAPPAANTKEKNVQYISSTLSKRPKKNVTLQKNATTYNAVNTRLQEANNILLLIEQKIKAPDEQLTNALNDIKKTLQDPTNSNKVKRKCNQIKMLTQDLNNQKEKAVELGNTLRRIKQYLKQRGEQLQPTSTHVDVETNDLNSLDTIAAEVESLIKKLFKIDEDIEMRKKKQTSLINEIKKEQDKKEKNTTQDRRFH